MFYTERNYDKMNGKFITKILLVVLSLIFVITAFASCGVSKDDFEALKTEVSDVEIKVHDNQKKLEEDGEKIKTLETKDVVAELRALAEQIKLTADAAATQTALAEAKAALEATDADNKTAAEKALADAKTALEASVATNKSEAAKALADAKAALEAADTANSAAAAKALADAKTALEATLASNAAADAATKSALETAIANLNGAVAQNKTDIEKALADAKAELNTADTAVANAAAKALADAEKALKDADAANAKAAADALADVKKELTDALTSNANTDAATKSALEVAIAQLTATVEQNKTNIEKALADAKAELNAADTAVANAAAQALTAAKAELNKTIADNKAAAEAALEGAVATLDKAYKDADKVISDSLNELKTKHDTLSGKVEAIEALIGNIGNTTVAAEIADIKSQLALLGSDIATAMDDFIKGYDLASKILAGEAVLGDFANEAEYNQYKDLTLDNFDARIKVITDREEWYANIGGIAAEEYKTFDSKTKNIRFFLGRATSKETVEALFTKLQNAIDELMTLDELFSVAVDDVIDNKKVTDKAESYGVATKIKNEIDKVNAAGASIVIPTEYVNKYNLIVSAQTNLAAAISAVEADVEDYIDLIDALIIYGVSETEIETARKEFTDFDTYYFKRTEVVEMVKLYDETKYTAILLVDNYDALTAAESRVAELNNAFNAKPAIIKVVAEFDTARPLWTDYDDIKTLDDAITVWANGNTDENGWAALEKENVEAILGKGNDALVNKALEYANAMKGFYEKYNKDNALKTLIEDINDDTLKLYSRYSEFTGAQTDLNNLENAIKEYDDYDKDLDKNFVTMIGEANISTFRGDAVTGQMGRLHKAYNDINGYKTAIENLITNDGVNDDVNIYDYDTVALTKTNIVVAYTTPNIKVDDANYNLIVKPAMDAYDRWIAAYKVKTAKIAEIYEAVKKGMTTGYTLAEGNEVVRINNLVLDLVKYYGVGNLNVKVYVDVEPVVLETVINQWNAFAGEFRTKAELAEEEAKAVNALVTEAFKNLSTDNLNNYAEITNAYKAFKAWADKHLGGLYTREAIEAIQAICKVNAPTEKYTFVLLANFDVLDDRNTKAEARKELSNEKWTDVADKFAALADQWVVGSAKTETQWDIHSKADFEAAEKAYQEFLTMFYTDANSGVGTVSVAYNGELAAKTLFDNEYTEFTKLMVTVDAEFAAINSAINTLMTKTLANIDASDITDIANIRTAIADFKKAYDCDVLTCDGGYGITADQRNFLARAQAKAAYTDEYNKSVTAAAGDAKKLEALATALDNANLLIGEATITGTTNTIKSVYDFAVSNFTAALA